MGLAPGSHVAIWLPNGLELPIVWMAAQRAGCVTTFLHAGSAIPDVERIISHFNPAALIAPTALLKRTPDWKIAHRIVAGPDQEPLPGTSDMRSASSWKPEAGPLN